jgi:hypothetical protein
MPKKTSQPNAESSSDEQTMPFAEHCEALRKGVALGLGNFRRASFLIESAVRHEREASQYRAQRQAIKAAGGPRWHLRTVPLTRTLNRLERERDKALSDADIALNAIQNLELIES